MKDISEISLASQAGSVGVNVLNALQSEGFEEGNPRIDESAWSSKYLVPCEATAARRSRFSRMSDFTESVIGFELQLLSSDTLPNN